MSERNNDASLPKARLLIVDDEAVQLRALTETLASRGFETHGFSDATQALAYLRNAPVDMLLTDLNMPGIDGIELVREALKSDPMLAAVVITGLGTIDTAVEAMRSGACDYILKPFKLSTILPVIERGLEMRRLRIDNAALERRVLDYVDELEAANRELDAFTRSASHDLRSPLNAVLGFAMLLRSRDADNLTAVQREWVTDIEQAARGMNRLIGDMLRLSQLGRQALVLEKVELGKLVSGVLGEVRRQYPDHPAMLSYSRMPQVRADESLLRQVFVNLVSNAFKFTAHTQEARIEIGFEEGAGERVYFVRDNGPGFDMSKADTLFQPFQRLHRPQEFEGSGVGLSIVQRIVQRHGGRVWAESAPDEGATFRFTLSEPSAEG